MRYQKIPNETIKRLPMYLRAISFMSNHDSGFISSRDIADLLNINSPQVRKDLSYFGAFGTRGTGYQIDELKKQIRKALKLDVTQKAVLVGAGKLGSALSLYQGFKIYGLDITAIYDNSPKKIGKKVGLLTIKDISTLQQIKNNDIKLAILAMPADNAQEIADILVKCGIKGILNLAPCYLKVPKKVKVTMIDIAVELSVLPFYT
ncbi:MAG: redox-sensing transcriptional repressor Rex [Sedimentisphaerales bacterium]|nr:redox-sensing transcriptional repressor Rex [Sedimentisphaerales bacterium]